LSLPARVPRTVLLDLASVLTPDASGGPIELIVISEDTGVNLREFAAYLTLIDRVYGRLSSRDLRDYAERSQAQLKVAQFRSGSLETIFTTAIESLDAQHLLVLWVFLKYLPTGVREVLGAYRDYEEARYARVQRRQLERSVERRESPAFRAHLRESIRADPELRNLSAERIRQLARLLDSLYSEEKRRLPAARRFSVRYVRRLKLRVGTRERSD
jgi:hypothetical protein